MLIEEISPMLGSTLAAVCLLLTGLGFVVQTMLVERRLQRSRAEYERRKEAHLQAERERDARLGRRAEPLIGEDLPPPVR